MVFDEEQVDLDDDGLGDACDEDRDGDGVANASDNCADIANEDQADTDGDGSGDACQETVSAGCGSEDCGDPEAWELNEEQATTTTTVGEGGCQQAPGNSGTGVVWLFALLGLFWRKNAKRG